MAEVRSRLDNGETMGGAMSEASASRIAQLDELMRAYASVSPGRRDATATQLDAIWSAALKRTGDPLLSVHLGEIFRPSASLYTTVLMWSPTIGDSLRNLTRYWMPHSTGSKFSTTSLEPHGSLTRLRYQLANGERGNRYDAEFRMCRILTVLRQLSEPNLAPARVLFEHAAPTYRDALEQWFQAPVAFGQPVTALEFNAASLELPVLATSAQRAGILRISEQLLAESPRTGKLSDLVRDTIRAQLPSGAFGMRAVAPRLGMSPRTLQRHLQRNDTSFQELLDKARKEECLSIMVDGQSSNSQIAERLGYSNVANFHRAFRRWFGRTPNQMRRELLAPAAGAIPPPGSHASPFACEP
jgi:AraC-like DNA-binding protein